jgi:SAM-dependent methyltransferase
MTACLMCGSGRLGPLYEAVRDRFGMAAQASRFLGCEECSSATLDTLPSPETIATLYPPNYTFKAADAHESPVRRLLARMEWALFYRGTCRRRLAIIRRLTGLATGRILEVGCGSGLFLRYLAAAGYEVEGVELSAADADYARQRLGLRVFQGSLESLALEPARYDAVLLFYVLEHIVDPTRTLTEARRILKPHGWVVAGLPVLDSGQSRLFGSRWSAVTEAPRHVAIPTFEGARRLLARAGFRDVRAVPSPLVENAGHVALSLLPAAATPRAWGGSGLLSLLLRRAAGAAMMLPGLVVAAAERLPGGARARTGTMIFGGRT